MLSLYTYYYCYRAPLLWFRRVLYYYINKLYYTIFFISVTRVTWYTVTAGSQPAVSSRPLSVCCCLPQYQSSYTYFTGVELRSFRRTCPNRAPCSLGAHCPSPKRNCEWFLRERRRQYDIIIILLLYVGRGRVLDVPFKCHCCTGTAHNHQTIIIII